VLDPFRASVIAYPLNVAEGDQYERFPFLLSGVLSGFNVSVEKYFSYPYLADHVFGLSPASVFAFY